jgi:hypothetical protein
MMCGFWSSFKEFKFTEALSISGTQALGYSVDQEILDQGAGGPGILKGTGKLA